MPKISALQILGINRDTELGHAGSIIVQHIRDYIQKSQDNASEQNAQKEEAALRTLYEIFFEYALAWVGEERKKYAREPNHPRAMDLRKKAGTVLSSLQTGMIKYATCYLRLSRSVGVMQREIETTSAPMEPGVEWTSESGVLMGRFRKEKITLEADNIRLTKAIALLDPFEADLTAFEEACKNFYGNETAEELLRSLRAALRGQDFERAQKSLKTASDAKLRFGADKAKAQQTFDTLIPRMEVYIKTFSDQPELFVGSENKLFLRSSEIRLVIQSQEKEIEQRRLFLLKYHQPYLHYKKASIWHLREKLLVIGSIESLMTLYIRLMRGFAQPMKDEKDVREYEHKVLENIDYLLTGQFQEIDRIDQRNTETLKEFHQAVEAYKKD
ncbi:MAG: hypothetical protein LRY54_03045 [Alphaproteobacteria bacterium]|nr:hypothetical protein [Alphaproteobacteria bacterium]